VDVNFLIMYTVFGIRVQKELRIQIPLTLDNNDMFMEMLDYDW